MTDNPMRSINLDVDTNGGVVTYSELRSRFKGVVQQLRTTQRPMLITVEGKTAGIIMSPELFEQVKLLLRGIEPLAAVMHKRT